MTYAVHHTTCQPRPRVNAIARLIAALGIARQRRQLRQLDAHLLRDIGVSHTEAMREANRPLWDAPDHWRIRFK